MDQCERAPLLSHRFHELVQVFHRALAEVKYDDGSTRTGIPLKQLRPLEQAESDGTGLSYTSSHNAPCFRQ